MGLEETVAQLQDYAQGSKGVQLGDLARQAEDALAQAKIPETGKNVLDYYSGKAESIKNLLQAVVGKARNVDLLDRASTLKAKLYGDANPFLSRMLDNTMDEGSEWWSSIKSLFGKDAEAYGQGFIEKCAEYGIDPRELAKFANYRGANGRRGPVYSSGTIKYMPNADIGKPISPDASQKDLALAKLRLQRQNINNSESAFGTLTRRIRQSIAGETPTFNPIPGAGGGDNPWFQKWW